MAVKVPELGLPKREPRDRSRISTLDYLLMSLSAMLAVYAAGVAVANEEAGWYWVRLVLMGTLVSFGARKLLRESPLLKWDGLLYFAGAVASVFFTDRLNTLLPGDPFPAELRSAAYLSWMLVLGSFFSWRDGTLLFQAVPAMALFGLIGCYDTYRDVAFAFFVFLLSLATLFSRANGRDMLRLAVESGYPSRADARNPDATVVRRDQALYERMRLGPWRWVAGPEWALLSAAVVIVLSLLGAPVIQAGVQQVTQGQRLQLRPPPNVRRNNAPTDQDLQRVGQGPNTGLSDRALYEVATRPTVPYLRTTNFGAWTGQGWQRNGNPGGSVLPSPGQTVRFTVRPLAPVTFAPTPGIVTRLERGATVRLTADGSYRWSSRGPSPDGRPFSGEAVIPAREAETGQTVEYAGNGYVDTATIHPDVVALAREAVQGATTDAERAEAIRRFVSRRCRYNLRAAAAPQDQDPVRFFLFESREGYCDLFASATTLMARAAGLPARYVQGYLTDAENELEPGVRVAQEKDYHAWCEIAFEGTGWTIYDATEGAEQVPGAERGQETTSPWAPGGWIRRALDGTLVILALVVIGGGAWYSWRNRRVSTPRSEIERLAATFSRSLEKRAGRRRRPAETLAEFARAMPEGERADALRDRFESALYGTREPTAETLSTLREELKRWVREPRPRPAG